MAVLLSAAIFGGGIYAYQNNKVSKDQKALKNQISVLEMQKANLEKQVAGSINSADTANPTSITSNTVAEETTDWKTYENSACFYSFKYPAATILKSWTGQGEDSPITIDATVVNVYGSGTGYIVEISHLSTSHTMTDYIKSNWKDKTMVETVVAGTNGYKVEVDNVDYYFVEKNDKKMQINVVKNNSIASKIFATFKFSK